MHKALLKLLGFSDAASEEAPGADTETVRKLVGKLDHLDPERARYVAAFAYVLSRVARADLKISDEETRAMETIVTEIGHLPPEQAVIVVQMAKTQNLLFGGTENYLVVKEFNAIADRTQKLDLLRCLFAVSAADEHVSSTEANVVRQIAEELRLERDDFIAVQSEFRDFLGVLKKPK